MGSKRHFPTSIRTNLLFCSSSLHNIHILHCIVACQVKMVSAHSRYTIVINQQVRVASTRSYISKYRSYLGYYKLDKSKDDKKQNQESKEIKEVGLSQIPNLSKSMLTIRDSWMFHQSSPKLSFKG